MRRYLLTSLASLGITLGACASGSAGAPASAAAAPEARQQSRNPNVVTAEELRTTDGDLYSAVQRLRPTFFQTRGNASFGNGAAPEQIEVYVEGMHRGSVETLREINAADVAEVRRLSAAEATQRFGTGNTLGAIVVTLKKS